MTKKKISKQLGLTLDDIVRVDLDEAKLQQLPDVKPEKFFKDHARVGSALLQCLIDNDPQAFIEILDSYLSINRTRVAKNANLSRAIVQLALSRRGNPTLKTIAKIAHHEAGYIQQLTSAIKR